MTHIKRRSLIGAIATVVVAASLSGCAAADNFISNIGSELAGRSATISTYDVDGKKLDSFSGSAINIISDDTFDRTGSDGKVIEESSVIKISIGKSTINHVGSTLLMLETGIVDISSQLPSTVSFENYEGSVPFLNNIRHEFQRLWQGRARTIMIRTQQGKPVAILAGNNVEYFSTDVDKSTMLRIDGKYAFIYRADYTIYDSGLLGN